MTTQSIDELLNSKREITSNYHFQVGRYWRLLGLDQSLQSPLIYSAFEFRCALERISIEILLLVKKKNPSEKDLKSLNRISDVNVQIYKCFGGKEYFMKTQIFNRIFSQGQSPKSEITVSIIDLDRLEKYWIRLSKYCHCQLKPIETWNSINDKWVADGYKLLKSVEDYLWEIKITSKMGWVHETNLEPELLDALNDFRNGKINQSTLKTRFLIMGPTIKRRIHGTY